MNQEYFDRLKWMYEITEKQTNINTIYGIELEIDNSVETYEFVYREGQV
ncbi:hypothetical protein [Gracilibacillus thailandensis]|uniref:Uncharacterized protein n=1 Tax=Gracilibacillus thailandensis TaxID=563735 RepID=A0A6N7QT07_9BACI|nr:hypothetical protein [Gracilibacillus thailandensis]MRI65148.1 hypothetical protein [Gracilibacillus thailandensis]